MASGTTDDQIARIARRIQRENASERRRVQEHVSEARREAERLVEDFRLIDPEIEKAILFGSLAEGRVRSARFDIDIAVRCKRYLQLVSRALNSAFPVDLVDLDSVPAHIRDSILRYGRIMYEKEG